MNGGWRSNPNNPNEQLARRSKGKEKWADTGLAAMYIRGHSPVGG